jgi:hypothetical protein
MPCAQARPTSTCITLHIPAASVAAISGDRRFACRFKLRLRRPKSKVRGDPVWSARCHSPPVEWSPKTVASPEQVPVCHLWPRSPCYGLPGVVLRLATAGRAGQTPSTALTRRMPLASAQKSHPLLSARRGFACDSGWRHLAQGSFSAQILWWRDPRPDQKARTKTNCSMRKGWLECLAKRVAAGQRSAR